MTPPNAFIGPKNAKNAEKSAFYPVADGNEAIPGSSGGAPVRSLSLAADSDDLLSTGIAAAGDGRTPSAAPSGAFGKAATETGLDRDLRLAYGWPMQTNRLCLGENQRQTRLNIIC